MAKDWTAPKTYKMFGHWRYSFDEGFRYKSDARKKAATLREKGLLARVVPGTDALGKKGYMVYWRRASY